MRIPAFCFCEKTVYTVTFRTVSNSHSLIYNKVDSSKRNAFITLFEPHHEKNKDADQLRGNREADQRLCFSLYE